MPSPVTIEYAGKNKNQNSIYNEKIENSMVESPQSGKQNPSSFSYSIEPSISSSNDSSMYILSR